MTHQALSATTIKAVTQPEPCLPSLALVLHKATGYYSDGKELYATIHELSDQDGQWRFKPGEVASLSDQQAIADALLGNVRQSIDQSAFLPQGVLLNTPAVCAWFLPSQRRAMHLVIGNERKTVMVKWPNLIAASSRRELYLVATDSKAHPDASTALYRAPLGNVYDGGKVCTGSAPKPSKEGVGAIEGWNRVIFESAFTHANTDSIKGHERTPSQFWLARHNQRQGIAKTKLIPRNQTLGEWIKAIAGGAQ